MPRKRRRPFTHLKNRQSPSHAARAAQRRERRVKLHAESQMKCQRNADMKNDGSFLGFDIDPISSNRPRLRLLSLFDGIGTVYFALKKMKFVVEEYFSSEIDSDAITVLNKNFEGQFVGLGSVTDLNSNALESLGKVNFLAAGSPCSQLSKVNHRRLCFSDPSSSAFLVFEFVRIRDFFLQKSAAENYKFFWLFENTANMDSSSRQIISSALGCEPHTHNAREFLPVMRKRFFWHNLPQQQRKCGHYLPAKHATLEELLPHYRTANVQVVPTITTNASSQRSGQNERLPVSEAGEDSPLYMNELEILQGLPPSFTDAANLSISRRRKLIGRAFCIPTIQSLLVPLLQEFRTEEEEEIRSN